MPAPLCHSITRMPASQPGKSWNDVGDAVQVANLQASQPDAGDAVARGRHACRLPTCRHHRAAGDAVAKGPACLQSANLQASQPGKSWKDASDAVAKGPACLQVANLASQPGANLQASQPGKSWNDAGDAVAKGPACLQVANLQASQPGWKILE